MWWRKPRPEGWVGTSVPARNPVLIPHPYRDTCPMAGQPLVGRSAELEVVERLLAGARAGRGGVVLVSGPAGIGKTRLTEAAVEHAQRTGMAVARGYAVDDPGAPPLWPWQRVLRGRADSVDLTEGFDAAARF